MAYEQLRRMINEPTDEVYSDSDLLGYLVEYDEDLNAVASVIWTEKAAALQATTYDISADGASYTYSQKIENAKELARTFASKRSPTTSLWIKSPEEEDDSDTLQVG
jgi:hypothetical protein